MDELKFDTRGNLTPYRRITLDLEEFRFNYVVRFKNSKTRSIVYESYIQYLNDFQEEITENFIQWIDGSFVSNKVNPNDIDFVTLIDHKVYSSNEKIIELKFRKFGANNHYSKVDPYTVKYYPVGHKKEKITQFDLAYWIDWFSNTKKNRARQKFPKGYIELRFGNQKYD